MRSPDSLRLSTYEAMERYPWSAVSRFQTTSAVPRPGVAEPPALDTLATATWPALAKVTRSLGLQLIDGHDFQFSVS